MNQKALLFGLLLLVGGIATALTLRQSDDAGLPPADAPDAVAEPALAGSLTADARPTDASAPAPLGETDRAVAATAPGTQRPFTADAPWVTVRVVDKASQQPVPDALVQWFDEAAWERLEEDQSMTTEDRGLLWRNVEAIAERAGWHTTTDKRGTARVTLQEWTTVTAEHGGRRATRNLQATTLKPADGFVLELEPDRQLSVQVLDDRGEPAPEVLVGLGQCDEGGTVQQMRGWGAAARTRAPDGIAVIRHLQDGDGDGTGSGAMEPPAGESRHWRVFTLLPGHDDKGTPVSIDSPPGDPVVLRLPSCGRVRARAEFAGSALPGFKTADLRQEGEQLSPHDISHAERRVDADGWARFQRVPLGRRYVASTEAAGGVSTTFVGPMAADQEVSVVIQPADDLILLRGRLVDTAREPVREQKVVFAARGPQLRANDALRTDADGRFLVALGPLRKNNRVEQISLVLARKGEVTRRAEAPARELRSGVEDLGDLMLADGTLVCKGQFRSGDSAYTKPVHFWVERQEPAVNDRPTRWRRVQDVFEHQDGAGGFSVRGAAPPGRHRLAFDTRQMLARQPVEFDVGAADLSIAVESGHPLAATVLLPEGAPQGMCTAVLVPAGPSPGAAPGKPDADRYRTHPWTESGTRHNLQWPALAPGAYALELRIWSCTEPLVTIADVQVPITEPGDPRLEDIDLRSHVRLLFIHLFDELGKPLESAEGAVFPAGQTADKEWDGCQIDEAVIPLLVRPGPLDLLVAVSGYRPCPAHSEGDRLDVRLDPWPTVEITIEGAPKMPEKVTLSARMQAIDPVETKYRSQWQDQRTLQLFGAPDRATRVDQGKAVLPIGDGPHTLVLSLYGNRRSAQLAGVQPAQFLASTRSVSVTVPAEQWAKALAEIQPPAK